MDAKAVLGIVLVGLIAMTIFFSGCIETESNLEKKAKEFCGQENVAAVFVSEEGQYVRVASSLLGGGSTYYMMPGPYDKCAPGTKCIQREISCPIVGPDSMSQECRELLEKGFEEKEISCQAQEEGKMQRFGSYEELVASFKEAQKGMAYGVMETIGGIPKALESAAQTSAEAGTADYSRTNIQVEGVDEADIVKTDGKYIYNFSNNLLVITDAYPIEDAKIVSKTGLENVSPQEMFVLGDRLLLFGSKSQYYGDGEIMRIGMPASYYGGSGTIIQLYNTSDRSNPVLEKEIEFEGQYLASRLVGNNAYFVINSFPDWRILEGEEEGNIIPVIKEDGAEKNVAEATEIAYCPPMPSQSFVTIASIDLPTAELQKDTIAGDAQNIHASQNNIYLASTAWLVPETPVIADLERAIAGGSEKTIINKFKLEGGKTTFVGQGSVPGRVLNQFSMDEFEENFRIATTLGQVSRAGDSQSTNNLYVLDGGMNVIGKLEDLAPGERIYSARFLGKKAYMVTFRKIDPLFVIDVSNPAEPKVLGKLKIPGYSDYLHPIDESHIMGIGKETIESTYGDFAWHQGLKMAIFDVSDVSNPIELHKIVVGDRGTDSFALHDHKAFLYDKEKELLVLPILLSEIPEEQKQLPEEEKDRMPLYGEPVFQGAFVYKVTLENGFEERGRITHVTGEDELKRGYYFGSEYQVKRALYIGNVLYTLSERMLKANALDTLEELKEFLFNSPGVK